MEKKNGDLKKGREGRGEREKRRKGKKKGRRSVKVRVCWVGVGVKKMGAFLPFHMSFLFGKKKG